MVFNLLSLSYLLYCGFHEYKGDTDRGVACPFANKVWRRELSVEEVPAPPHLAPTTPAPSPAASTTPESTKKKPNPKQKPAVKSLIAAITPINQDSEDSRREAAVAALKSKSNTNRNSKLATAAEEKETTLYTRECSQLVKIGCPALAHHSSSSSSSPLPPVMTQHKQQRSMPPKSGGGGNGEAATLYKKKIHLMAQLSTYRENDYSSFRRCEYFKSTTITRQAASSSSSSSSSTNSGDSTRAGKKSLATGKASKDEARRKKVADPAEKSGKKELNDLEEEEEEEYDRYKSTGYLSRLFAWIRSIFSTKRKRSRLEDEFGDYEDEEDAAAKNEMNQKPKSVTKQEAAAVKVKVDYFNMTLGRSRSSSYADHYDEDDEDDEEEQEEEQEEEEEEEEEEDQASRKSQHDLDMAALEMDKIANRMCLAHWRVHMNHNDNHDDVSGGAEEDGAFIVLTSLKQLEQQKQKKKAETEAASLAAEAAATRDNSEANQQQSWPGVTITLDNNESSTPHARSDDTDGGKRRDNTIEEEPTLRCMVCI